MSFMSDLAPLFDSTVTAQQGYVDGAGTWFASGAPQNFPARYEGGPHTVASGGAQVVTSGLLCLINGVLPSHDSATMRFTIPAVFAPQTAEIQAIRIDPVFDETGVISAEIYLP
jgi:hypothetical protein